MGIFVETVVSLFYNIWKIEKIYLCLRVLEAVYVLVFSAWLKGVAVVETISEVLLCLAVLVQLWIFIRGRKNPLIRKLFVALSGGAGME